VIECVRRWWCRHFHGRIYRPVHGVYRCATCLREFRVSWSEDRVTVTVVEIPEAACPAKYVETR